SLIRLYTLETPLYRFINRGDDSKMIFATLMNNCKDLLYGRSFTGTTYRGLGMTSDDLQIYHWARENPDRYLQLNTFCSSTLDEPLAKIPSVNAIGLYQISNQLHSYSDFQDEQEVLIVPGIAFSVTNIEQTSSLITISMTHLNLIEKMAEFENILIDEQLSSY
ncbi:unnamed protein product, partial [Rotaria sp. Silwood1]